MTHSQLGYVTSQAKFSGATGSSPNCIWVTHRALYQWQQWFTACINYMTVLITCQPVNVEC